MKKLPKVRYVKFTRAKGKVYAYFNTGRKVNGKTVWAALPAYSSAGFWDSHAAMMGARTKRETPVFTVAKLAEAYEASAEFRALSAGTQKVYRITLAKVVDYLGELQVETLTRKHVRAINDVIPGAASRNLFVAVVGVLYKWARGRDMTEANPTEGIAKSKTGEHSPWPDDLLALGLAAENDLVRLTVCLLYNSGQRLGDAIKLRWSDIRGGKMHITQQKTGKALEVPISEALGVELARTVKRGLTVLAQANGRPISAETVRRALKGFAADHGFAAVPHGLRKNAVNSLLLAGCTVPQVQAITGQSAEMVAHYAKQIDQGQMGEAAILKLDNRARNVT